MLFRNVFFKQNAKTIETVKTTTKRQMEKMPKASIPPSLSII